MSKIRECCRRCENGPSFVCNPCDGCSPDSCESCEDKDECFGCCAEKFPGFQPIHWEKGF